MRRSQKIVVAVSAAILLLFIVYGVGDWARRAQYAPTTPVSGTLSLPSGYLAAKPLARPLYPLSVLPGGAATVSEFNMRASQDPTLKSLVCPEASTSTTPADIVVFTTFRRGNTIKWNRKPIVVKRGEKLIVGCGRTLLARCANQISFTPEAPSEELPLGTLETPVTENAAPPETIAPPVTAHMGEITAIENIAPPTFGGGGFPGGPGGFGPPQSTPIRTPEPSTLLLICFGILVLSIAVYFDSNNQWPQWPQ